MGSKVYLSCSQNIRQPVANCAWYGNDTKFLGSGNADVNHPLGFSICPVLSSYKKLFSSTRLSKVRRNDHADSLILLPLRFVDSGAP